MANGGGSAAKRAPEGRTATGAGPTGAVPGPTGAGAGPTGAGAEATGAGAEATGAGAEATGAGAEATGAGAEPTGAGAGPVAGAAAGARGRGDGGSDRGACATPPVLGTARFSGTTGTRTDGSGSGWSGPRRLAPCALVVGDAATSPSSATSALASTDRPE